MPLQSVNTYRTLIVLQPTPFCNIDCKYCYLPDRSNATVMLPAVIERVATEILSSDEVEFPAVFLWHLGEPLAVPRNYYNEAFAIFDRVNEKFEREFSHSFQTNGTLIDDHWVDLILRHRVRIGLSVDGPAFIHDRQRVTRSKKGTHADVMRGIGLLQAAKIPFGTISVLTDFALDYADDMYRFFLDHNIDDVAFNIDEIDGLHQQTSFAEPESVERYRQFMLRLLTLCSRPTGQLKIREIWTTLRTLSIGHENPYNTTNQPLRIINVSANGDFSTFCPELRAARSKKYSDFVMGNLVTGSLSQIWDNAVFQQVNAEIQRGVARCQSSCDYWAYCGGGSPSNKFFEFGHFDVTETTACRIHKMATLDTLVSFIEQRLKPELADAGTVADASLG